jgi:hypothetical protein
MVIFVIVMVVIALLAAVGFILANNHTDSVEEPAQDTPVDEDIVTYLAAEIPSILHETLSAVPVATDEEAMVGCYGTMGNHAHPLQVPSLDELLLRITDVIASMEDEQHIAKFTVSTHAKSKANPHVDMLAHSTDPKRDRLVRFWRTPKGFIATVPQ